MPACPHDLTLSCPRVLVSSCPHVLMSSVFVSSCHHLLIYSSPHLLISSSPHLLISSPPHLLISSSPHLLISSCPHVVARKAARATLILIPLLGLQYIIFPLRPNKGNPFEELYLIASAVVTSLQVRMRGWWGEGAGREGSPIPAGRTWQRLFGHVMMTEEGPVLYS